MDNYSQSSDNRADSVLETGQSTAADAIGRYAVGLAKQSESDRRWIEDRWIEDIRQLNDLSGNSVNYQYRINITKPKTLSAEARISDMLFQKGDKNFSIDPDKDTPEELLSEAQKGSDLLEDKVTAILDDGDYETVGRRTIKFATQLGVGVLSGLDVSVEFEKEWKQIEGESGVLNALQVTQVKKAKPRHVSTWNYFPDMSVEEHNDCAYEFERMYLSKKDLQKLMMRGDFNNEAIIDVISIDSVAPLPRYITELQDNVNSATTPERYIIWKGCLTVPSDMVRELCKCNHEESGSEFEEQQERQVTNGVHYQEEDIDEDSFDVECVVWVSDSGKLLKFAPNPLETEERPFSVFCYDLDTSCFMASKGIPRLIKQPQEDINRCWTRIQDNADLSVGPQWIVDTTLVEPLQEYGPNGEVLPLSWKMTGNKGWRQRIPGRDMSKAFTVFNIPSGIQENMVIMQKALEFVDMVTQLPQITSGDVPKEQGRMSHETFSMLFNAAGSSPRRIIKEWDDSVTVPFIGRCIDYVMQNDPIPGVQGKFTANAKGTSGLLLRETMAQNAVTLSGVAGSNPKFAQKTNWDELYKQIIRGLQYDPAVVTYSEEELQRQAQENPPQPQPEMIEAQANLLEAQNEQKKIGTSAQAEAWKDERERISLDQRAKKDKADTMVSMAKLKIEEKKLELGIKGKATETIIKSKAKQEEIKLSAKAKESGMVQQAILERDEKVNI